MDNVTIIKDKINVKPYSPSIGGVITGINLSKKLNELELKFVKDCFFKYQVFFKKC